MFKKLFEIGTSKYDCDSDVFCLITFTQNALWKCPFPIVWTVWWYFFLFLFKSLNQTIRDLDQTHTVFRSVASLKFKVHN